MKRIPCDKPVEYLRNARLDTFIPQERVFHRARRTAYRAPNKIVGVLRRPRREEDAAKCQVMDDVVFLELILVFLRCAALPKFLIELYATRQFLLEPMEPFCEVIVFPLNLAMRCRRICGDVRLDILAVVASCQHRKFMVLGKFSDDVPSHSRLARPVRLASECYDKYFHSYLALIRDSIANIAAS